MNTNQQPNPLPAAWVYSGALPPKHAHRFRRITSPKWLNARQHLAVAFPVLIVVSALMGLLWTVALAQSP